MIIAVDFDGTCVTHEYPETGSDIGATKTLFELVDQGHKLILWTMRSGQCLGRAVDWFRDNNIELMGVNNNPFQSCWTDSPKAYAELYIDDAALGVPLIVGAHARPYVDWVKVRLLLKKKGLLL
jgi:hypothetical protein